VRHDLSGRLVIGDHARRRWIDAHTYGLAIDLDLISELHTLPNMRRLVVHRNPPFKDQLLHLQTGAQSSLRQHLMQFGCIGLGRKHPFGRVQIRQRLVSIKLTGNNVGKPDQRQGCLLKLPVDEESLRSVSDASESVAPTDESKLAASSSTSGTKSAFWVALSGWFGFIFCSLGCAMAAFVRSYGRGGGDPGWTFDQQCCLSSVAQGPQRRHVRGITGRDIDDWKLIQRLNAQIIQELARRCKQCRTTSGLPMSDHLDPAAVFQLLEDERIDHHAPNILHVSPGHWLPIGNDGQSLQGRARVLWWLFGMQPVKELSHFRAALEAPTRRHTHEFKPRCPQSCCKSASKALIESALKASSKRTRRSRTGTGCCEQIKAVSRIRLASVVFMFK
jgi:hypothetical protein